MRRIVPSGLSIAFFLLFPLVAAYAQKITPKADTAYSYGEYTFLLDSDAVLSMWADGGAFALEFVGDSNGYWGLYSGDYAYTVWSSGTVSDNEFYAYPWENAQSKPIVVKEGSYFILSTGEYSTKFLFSKGNITVTMSDGGILSIPSRERTVNFTLNDQSAEYVYPDQIDELYESDEGDSYSPELTDIGLIGRRVKVADAGKVYPMINTTDLIGFPDEDTKTLAGAGSWGKWKPKNGDSGTVVWQSQHADTYALVCIVMINGNYVCIAGDALQTTSEQIDSIPFIESYHGYQ